MSDLSMLDMNSLNAIAAYLHLIGSTSFAEVLWHIQDKATKMIKERDSVFTFKKTVNVTNHKNILVQVPRAVAADWGLRVGDKLEVAYNGDTLTIYPTVQGRGDTLTQSN